MAKKSIVAVKVSTVTNTITAVMCMSIRVIQQDTNERQKMESWKMKGYTIDCNYVVRVSHLMELLHLPYPRRRQNVLINDGERLPIILVGDGR